MVHILTFLNFMYARDVAYTFHDLRHLRTLHENCVSVALILKKLSIALALTYCD